MCQKLKSLPHVWNARASDCEYLPDGQGCHGAVTIGVREGIHRPPARAMARRDQGKTERSDVAHGFGNDLLVAARQVEAASNSIDRDRRETGLRMFENVDDTCVREGREYDNAFAAHVNGQKALVRDERIIFPRLAVLAPLVAGEPLLVARHAGISPLTRNISSSRTCASVVTTGTAPFAARSSGKGISRMGSNPPPVSGNA